MTMSSTTKKENCYLKEFQQLIKAAVTLRSVTAAFIQLRDSLVFRAFG